MQAGVIVACLRLLTSCSAGRELHSAVRRSFVVSHIVRWLLYDAVSAKQGMGLEIVNELRRVAAAAAAAVVVI